jgi:hypothetical protein
MGVVDIDGRTVAEVGKFSKIGVLLHELLTMGIKTKNVSVQLLCRERESEGLSDFKIQGVLRSDLGVRPVGFEPSRSPSITAGVPGERPTGLIDTLRPGVSTTTTTAVGDDDDDEGGGTPGCGIPHTHTFSVNPIINSINVVATANGYDCIGAGNYSIEATVDYFNRLPTIVGGDLISIESSTTWTPRATFTYEIPDDFSGPSPYLYHTSYTYAWPGEDGVVVYYFCYLPPGAPDPLGTNVYFRVRISDACGYTSAEMRCCGDVPTNAITCPCP